MQAVMTVKMILLLFILNPISFHEMLQFMLCLHSSDRVLAQGDVSVLSPELQDKASYLAELCGSSKWLMEKRKFRNAVRGAMAVSLLFLLSTHHSLSAKEPWPAGKAAWLTASFLFG